MDDHGCCPYSCHSDSYLYHTLFTQRVWMSGLPASPLLASVTAVIWYSPGLRGTGSARADAFHALIPTTMQHSTVHFMLRPPRHTNSRPGPKCDCHGTQTVRLALSTESRRLCAGVDGLSIAVHGFSMPVPGPTTFQRDLDKRSFFRLGMSPGSFF